MATFDFDFDAAFSDIFGKEEKVTAQDDIILSLFDHVQKTIFRAYSKDYPKELLDMNKWYDKAVEGDAKAQNNLGFCYYNENKYVEALEWFNKAAEQGIIEAQFNLAACDICLNGSYGCDYRQVLNRLLKVAEQGMAEAQHILGQLYYNGRIVDQNYYNAVDWYFKAAEQGFSPSQNKLGICYQYGQGVLGSDKAKKAFEWYIKAAEQGFGPGQYNLGKCYARGVGVTTDPVRAIEWYTKAAEQGYRLEEVQDYLSRYLTFEGETKDAEKGDASAQYSLGEYYRTGDFVNKDLDEAFRWYTKAAEQGNRMAYERLIEWYYYGEGVDKDLAKAVELTIEGGVDNTGCFGGCVDTNVLIDSCDEDKEKGFQMLSKLAEHGFSRAQFLLGNRYRDGNGTEQDLAKAVEWYTKAADRGDDAAQQALKDLGVNNNQ